MKEIIDGNPAPMSDAAPALAGIPFNRLVAFVGPYVAIGSGVIADWLLVHVHFLGLFHFQHDGLATGIAQLVVFLLTAGVTWLGHQTWLKGHHIEMAQVAALARLAAPEVFGELVSGASDAGELASESLEYGEGTGLGKPETAMRPDVPA